MLKLLRKIHGNKFSIWLEDGNLQLDYDGSEEHGTLIEQIRNNKDMLVSLLERYQVNSPSAFNRMPFLKDYPLSFAQQRLLFIEQLEQGTDAYHIPHCVKLSDNVSLEALVESANKVVNRHSVLKTIYLKDVEGNLFQRVLEGPITLDSYQVSSEQELMLKIQSAIGQPFDLSSEPSMRLKHFQLSGTDYLLIVWHHIAFDGWS
uniref:condensation domain-containing protein n=1 Tax=Aliikangiella sp. G2MR2-5 TaxID=2788943 RepID=UPI0018A96975